MAIPPPADPTVDSPDPGWTALSSDAKYARILAAAHEVFARCGIEASMPSVAAAAGAGVASLYRQFPSKRELLVALLVARLQDITASATAAAHQPGDGWAAFTAFLHQLVDEQTAHPFLVDAWAQTSDHPDVEAANERTTAALEQLMARARVDGRLRADATATDVWLLLSATRAARSIEPGAWERTLQLLIDGLDTHR